jgi:Ferric reductase like transmembrane component
VPFWPLQWDENEKITGNAIYIFYLGLLAVSIPPLRRHVSYALFYWAHVALAMALLVACGLHAGSILGIMGAALALWAVDVVWRAHTASKVSLPS